MSKNVNTIIEENFGFIYDYIQESLGISLHDNIDDDLFEEASRGRLKYDFRIGWDYNTGHQVRVIYSLENITITKMGDFWLTSDENINPDGSQKMSIDDLIKFTQNNIRYKGNGDHESKGQKILAIVDNVTNQRLKSVKLISPIFLDSYGAAMNYSFVRKLSISADDMKSIRDEINKNSPNAVSELREGMIDNTPSFKSTHYASRTIDPKTGDDYRFRKISTTELYKTGRGQKINNIFAKGLTIFGDNTRYMVYHNPNKIQALRELRIREQGIINIMNRIRSCISNNKFPTGWSITDAENHYYRNRRILNIIRTDIKEIENGHYDLSIMKKYRKNGMVIESNDSIEESLDWIDQFVHNDLFRESVSQINSITTPQDLLKWMDHIQYGWVSKDDGVISKGNDDEVPFYDFYYLQSSEDMMKSGVGVCWDQTELERQWFSQHGYEFHVYYIELIDGKDNPTHTFVIYKDKGQWYYFEHAWETYKGIHHGKSEEELLQTVIWNHRRIDNNMRDPVFISRMDKIPNKGIGCQEFMDFAHKCTKINPAPYNPSSLYDPPMDYDHLPANLKNDPIHVWRAMTGIELIHKEPSLDELERIWKNWNMMSDIMKQISDDKSRELFNKTNSENYTELVKQYQESSNGYTMDTLPNIMYHGSKEKYDVFQPGRSLFLTPYKGIASLFIVDTTDAIAKAFEEKTGHKPKNISCNTGYDEWESSDNNTLVEPVTVAHITHNIPELTNVITGTSIGYIHSIDISDIKDQLKLFSSNDPDREVYYNGPRQIKPINIIRHIIKWEMRYDPKQEKHFGRGICEGVLEDKVMFNPYEDELDWMDSFFNEADDQEDQPANEEESNEEAQPEPEEKPTDEQPEEESRPKKVDKAESDKNGVRRKKLYIAFIEWCKKYNSKNTFGSIFDKDVFHVAYPFVPEEMRYFYRLANPLLCVLSGNLTFFQVSELRKLNSKNSHLQDMMIFAATEEDMRVFNNKDKKVYRAIDKNGALTLQEVLGNTFDTYIQKMVGEGDILNAPLGDE